MSIPLRLLLVFLLSLAIPLQGYAAAAMSFCGPVHQRMAGADAAASADHDHRDDATHVHAHAHAHHDEAASSASDAGPGLDDLQLLAGFDCSACAACCVAAALLPFTELNMPAALPDAALAPRPLVDTVVFLTDGLERPPR